MQTFSYPYSKYIRLFVNGTRLQTGVNCPKKTCGLVLSTAKMNTLIPG